MSIYQWQIRSQKDRTFLVTQNQQDVAKGGANAPRYYDGLQLS
tara:strand:+ start:1543 stop:1671 length:129 start_codon:yes stop_codon:yes gene_type:complete